MARILLLGGTGAMGEHLTRILEKQNHHIVVTSRRTMQSHSNVHYVKGNAHDNDFLKQLLAECFDVVVDFMVYNTEEFEKRYTLLLDSCKQYVYLSSSRVYASSSTPVIEDAPRLLDVSDDSDFLATDEYSLAKARQENLLRTSGRKNYTIIRPYITFSENRLQLGVFEKENWMYRAIHGRTIFFSKDIADKYTTLTYGFNVAEGIASVLNKPKAFGEAFHITIDRSYRWSELLSVYQDVIEQRIGKRPKVILSEECPNLKLTWAQYQVKYDRYYNRRFNNDKIKRFIDTSHFLPTKEGLELCLNRFMDNPQFLYVDWRQEALQDRIAGEYTPLNEIPAFKQKIKYLVYRYFSFEKK